MTSGDNTKLLVLSGGVGGAKLVQGLADVLAPEQLTIVANTGDDFEHLGFYISPDIDTILYTLSGRSNVKQGWGHMNETWSFMQALKELDGESWFQLGDKDLATHVIRRQLLAEGATLSEATADISRRFGIKINIIPMSDCPIRTIIESAEREYTFQEYFVKHQCQPAVRKIKYHGLEQAKPSPGFTAALQDKMLKAIIITPSNPYLSIDPILAIPAIKNTLQQNKIPVIAVSPIVAGRALKGPTAKIMSELGVEVTAVSVAKHYTGLVDHFVIDDEDAGLAEAIRELGISVHSTNTVMLNMDDKRNLAADVLDIVYNYCY